MNNTQEVYRQKLINYCRENGIKYKYIAKRLDISNAYISYFVNNKRNFSEDLLKKLNSIIDN